MLKFISFSLFCLLCLSPLTVSAKETAAQNAKQAPKADYSQVDENFDFSENSYNISDEQLEDAKNIDKIEDDSSFLQKIINSSHFSSGTATKTYIPINKSL